MSGPAGLEGPQCEPHPPSLHVSRLHCPLANPAPLGPASPHSPRPTQPHLRVPAFDVAQGALGELGQLGVAHRVHRGGPWLPRQRFYLGDQSMTRAAWARRPRIGRTGKGEARRQCRSTPSPPDGGAEGPSLATHWGPTGRGSEGRGLGAVRHHPDAGLPPPPTGRRWEKRSGRGHRCSPPGQITPTVCMEAGRKTDRERREVCGCGRAHHSDKIPAAVLAHQLLLATATLDDAAQPPVEHDVGAVRAVALSGVGCASRRI